MSSTQVRPKLPPSGFFICVGNNAATVGNPSKVLVNIGSESAPVFSTNIYSVSGPTSTVCNQGGIMKDLGKSLVSSGRVFRKVQLLISSPVINQVGSGPGNGPTPDYATAYIELPSMANVVNPGPGALAQVARLG